MRRAILPIAAVATAALTATTALAGGAPTLAINWFTIDSGGGTSTGGGFTLSGTIGQPDAGQAMSGGGFTLTGGFWPGFSIARCGPSDVAGANQSVGADGALTADDIIVFLGWYFASDTRADVAGPNQSTTPDASFTADDIIVFLGRYFAGC